MKKIELPSTRQVLSKIGYVIAIAFLALVALHFRAVGNGTATEQDESFFGYKPVIVVTGSMEPAIKVNSISILKYCSIDDLQVGDVVMYKYGVMKVTHRVIEKNEDVLGKYLITKGDANEVQDKIDIKPDMVVGKLIRTYNGAAPIISYFMLAPGEINSAAVSQAILFLIVFIYIAGLVIFHFGQFASTLVTALFDKTKIESYLVDYRLLNHRQEKLESEIEQLARTESSNRLVAAFIKAKLIKEIKALKVSIRDFEKQIGFIRKVKDTVDKKDSSKEE